MPKLVPFEEDEAIILLNVCQFNVFLKYSSHRLIYISITIKSL